MMAAIDTKNAVNYVYDFADGSREMRDLLGGKGANLCEMTRRLEPGVVPAGFVITTAACVEHMSTGGEPEALAAGSDGSVYIVDTAGAAATATTRCCCLCARARASRCPG